VLTGSDSYGNALAWSATRTVVVDNTPPAVLCSWNPNPFNPHIGQTSTCTCMLSEKCSISIKIYNSASKLVKTLLAWTTKDAGTHNIIWDGTNNSGTVVAAGTYTCRIYATDTAGNQVSPYPKECTIQVS